jgi:hypothetical protein
MVLVITSAGRAAQSSDPIHDFGLELAEAAAAGFQEGAADVAGAALRKAAKAPVDAAASGRAEGADRRKGDPDCPPGKCSTTASTGGGMTGDHPDQGASARRRPGGGCVCG